MRITRSQLKEIIREELGLIRETTIKTKSGHKVELSAAGSKLKIHTHRGAIEIKGHKQLSQFVNILKKNMGIV
jgi:hypothetical protein